MNRMTGFTPRDALSLDKAGRETLRERVLRSQEEGGRPPRPDYPVNLAVRVKLAKGPLSKSTDWSWSKRIYIRCALHWTQIRRKSWGAVSET